MALPEGDPPFGDASFDDLLREMVSRMHGALDEQSRLRLLLDAVVTMAADLTLDGVLGRIVEVASRIVGAQYAALGVIGPGGPDHPLITFVHHGFAPDVAAAIGDLPAGHGLLGQIIECPGPLRLHSIAAHPASYGFPPGHPPMSSFLGVPVRIRDQVFGNLYLTEKKGGADFTEGDEEIVVALAAAAGVAIENARLYEEAAQRQAWLAATAEITRLLSGSDPGADTLQAVADRAREVAGADYSWIVSGRTDEDMVVEAIAGADVDPVALRSLPLTGTVSREVVLTGTPVSVPDLEAGGSPAPGGIRVGPAVIVPLRASDGAAGALALAWTHAHAHRARHLDPALPASFAEQAALALQVAQARSDQQLLALFEDRDRIGRDLHDLVIQRLFAVGLGLQGAARQVEEPALATRLEGAVDELDATIRDIRRTIFALGSDEARSDLQAEVARLVDRAAQTLKFRPTLRVEGPVRTAVPDSVAPHLLAVLGEALSNASRHAGARSVDVLVTVGPEIALTVTDDGRGLPAGVPESGLRNLRQRAEELGGACEVSSAPGEGTTVRWVVPLRRPAP